MNKYQLMAPLTPSYVRKERENKIRHPIPGYEDLYITRGGAVWVDLSGGKKNHWSSPSLITSGNGREYVTVDTKDASYKLFIDETILRTFAAGITHDSLNKLTNPVPLHKNGIMSDNRLSNLRWVEAEELEASYAKTKKERAAKLKYEREIFKRLNIFGTRTLSARVASANRGGMFSFNTDTIH